MKARLAELLERLGLRASPRAEDDATKEEELHLLLALEGERVPIGRLRKDGDDFVFEYFPDFAARNIPALPDFPYKEKIYRSPVLWPFFLARLPPSDRSDVETLLQERGIEPHNALEILGKLSQRAVSSPYEIELAQAS